MAVGSKPGQRRDREDDLELELRSHLALEAEEQREAGLTAEEAGYAARRAFGNAAVVKEEVREMWGWTSLERLLQDVRYAARTMRRNVGVTAVAVLSLSLGIGANTAIFTLIDAVMLKALPVRQPEQLVMLNWVSRKWPSRQVMSSQSGYSDEDKTGRATSMSFSYPAFEQFRSHNQVLSSIFGFVPLGFGSGVNVSIDGQPSLATGDMVTGEYFSGLGVAPILGRAITVDDEKPGAAGVVIISYEYWTRQFGRAPSVLGKAVTLNSEPYAIVGVTPAEFFGVEPGRAPDFWIPLADEPGLGPWGGGYSDGQSLFSGRGSWWLMMMGRLKPGVTGQQASAQLDVVFQQDVAAGLNPAPKPEELPHVELTPGSQGLKNLRQRFSKPLFLLLALVALVLLIACANVATLLLARATARSKEMGVRLALGASRTRLMRQLLTESMLMAGFGGLLGLLFAYWGTHALLALITSGNDPVALKVHPNLTVLGYTAALSLITGILFGLAPAARATRVEVTPSLKESASTLAQGSLGLAKPLVAGQMALCLVLLFGTGLFVRTLVNLENQSLGFDQHNLLLFGIDATSQGYKNERLASFYDRMLERIRALPGVRAATFSALAPISGWQNASDISIEGYKPEAGLDMNLKWNAVGPEFFDTFGMRLLLGRAIAAGDTVTSPKVAVVNEAMARHFFGNGNPIGRQFHFERTPNARDLFTIVGVVANAKYSYLREETKPIAYFPDTQMLWALDDVHFEVRTAGSPAAMVPAIRRVVRDFSSNLPLADIKTQSEQINESVMQERLFARLSSFFGVLALLLACVGLYGTMSYAVNRRTNEIGVRMALGAQRGNILTMILRETSLLVLMGLAIGIPAALAVARVASSQISDLLYGLKVTDTTTIVLAAALLAAVAAFAGFLPARRASRVDPMVALRYE
jgi:predicted permease